MDSQRRSSPVVLDPTAAQSRPRRPLPCRRPRVWCAVQPCPSSCHEGTQGPDANGSSFHTGKAKRSGLGLLESVFSQVRLHSSPRVLPLFLFHSQCIVFEDDFFAKLFLHQLIPPTSEKALWRKVNEAVTFPHGEQVAVCISSFLITSLRPCNLPCSSRILRSLSAAGRKMRAPTSSFLGISFLMFATTRVCASKMSAVFGGKIANASCANDLTLWLMASIFLLECGRSARRLGP